MFVDWSKQQIAVTLNGVFTFQHGNHDRARGHEFNQTISNGSPSFRRLKAHVPVQRPVKQF
ncbi:hypothetical protein [Escherichia coli]|uniref:hypothetical protein n=1 Tax=Escherichia coli TaxID=562 RepID=UPI00202BB7EE|nr:hypothetical protein [Escherichia coli]